MAITAKHKTTRSSQTLLREAFDALLQSLGADKTMRVWQALVPGGSNYIKERKNLFAKKTVAELYREARVFNKK
jgi:hypothetical protein